MKTFCTIALTLVVGLLFSSTEIDLSKRVYEFSSEPIDVVIPACPKDLLTLEECIEGIRAYGKGVRRIIVVSKDYITDSAEWYDEALYPFSIRDVAIALAEDNVVRGEALLHSSQSRVGWYYQQLLKFYAPFVIPGISSNVLILDSDTIFLNPVSFVSEEGGSLFNTSVENHHEYFRHIERFIPGLTRIYSEYSGIAHHMLFQRPILEDLMEQVENYHYTVFWKAFCECVSQDHLTPNSSGASEYEIYFNFALARTTQVRIRNLKWDNIPFVEEIEMYRSAGYDYVSCHGWLRERYLPYRQW